MRGHLMRIWRNSRRDGVTGGLAITLSAGKAMAGERHELSQGSIFADAQPRGGVAWLGYINATQMRRKYDALESK